MYLNEALTLSFGCCNLWKYPVNNSLKGDLLEHHPKWYYPGKQMNNIVTPDSDICEIFTNIPVSHGGYQCFGSG